MHFGKVYVTALAHCDVRAVCNRQSLIDNRQSSIVNSAGSHSAFSAATMPLMVCLPSPKIMTVLGM